VATAFLALGFLVLGLAVQLTGPEARISIAWLLVTFMLLVAGELCLAPMSQSMVTRLAPRRIVGVMVGCLLLTNSASAYISSLMASLPTGQGSAGYATFYMRLGLIALTVCVVLLLLSPFLKRLMRETPAS
jgi:POT family proton-dependent oligopeptide transporter